MVCPTDNQFQCIMIMQVTDMARWDLMRRGISSVLPWIQIGGFVDSDDFGGACEWMDGWMDRGEEVKEQIMMRSDEHENGNQSGTYGNW